MGRIPEAAAWASLVMLAAGLTALTPAPTPAPTPTAGAGHAWRDYVNVRYRYAVCYPSDLLKAQPEAPNSDGRTFDAADGAELAVFGRNNVDHQSLEATVKGDAQDMAGRAGQVTYRAGKTDWAVYSGKTPTGYFYSKIIRRGDQYVIFKLKYPNADAAVYAAVAARISRCFRTTS